MTPPSLDLACRAVACKGWRWMPRMAVRPVLSNGTVESAVGTIIGFIRSMPVVWWPDLASTRLHHPTEHLLPDLSDPATLGCMLALVREAWGAPYAQASPRLTGNPTRATGWVAYLNDDEADRRFYASSEAEALVAALEAAPAAGGAR